MDKACVPLTVETLAVRLEEFRLLMAERWRAQEMQQKILATSLSDYKATANEFRQTINDANLRFVTKGEYDIRHTTLENSSVTTMRFLEQRLEGMDRKRDDIDRRLIRIEARAGYINVSIIIAIISALIAVGAYWHPVPPP